LRRSSSSAGVRLVVFAGVVASVVDDVEAVGVGGDGIVAAVVFAVVVVAVVDIADSTSAADASVVVAGVSDAVAGDAG